MVAVAGQLPRDPAVRPTGRVPLLAMYGDAERWTDGAGTVAVLRTVVGGGHTWPSWRTPAPEGFGPVSRDLDASAEAVRFVIEGDVTP